MNPPANWYPDPTGRHGQRYWDGEQWTEHVFTEGVQGVDPLDQATPVSDTATPDAEPAGDAPDTVATAEEPVADAASDDDGGAPAEHEPEDTSGLFEDASDHEADDASGHEADDASGQEAWTPGDGTDGGDDEAVARAMEAEDVVASLDEVGEAEEDTAPPSAGDMSDAFVLAPETASRIVKRRTAEATAEDGAAGAAGAAAAEAPEPVGGAEDADEAVGSAVTAASAATMPAPTPSTTQAPPASTSPAADGDLGITGDLLSGAFEERSEAGPVALQNNRLLRCAVTPGEAVVARQGTMVAYQGDVSFDRQGAGGVTRALKRAATGEGLAMMRAEGSGDVFFADGAQHVFLLQLAGGPGLSVNGRNVLAFSAALAWDIERVKGATLLAGGLFNTTFTGTGWVALVSDGEPVVLQTDEAATHVDVNALVAWSAGLSTRIVNSVSAKSLVGLGSGEAFQMAFDGHGIVIVQPSEGPLGGAAAT